MINNVLNKAENSSEHGVSPTCTVMFWCIYCGFHFWQYLETAINTCPGYTFLPMYSVIQPVATTIIQDQLSTCRLLMMRIYCMGDKGQDPSVLDTTEEKMPRYQML